MLLRFLFMPIPVAAWLLLAGLVLPQQSALAADLESLPGSAPVGAEVIARGERYLANELVELRLRDGASGADELLGFFPADDAGNLLARVVIPAVTPGNFRMEALDDSGTLLATAVQVVEPAPTLSLFPNVGEPGTLVRLQLGSVPAGSVEIRYDGIAVLGPLAHDGGPFNRQFVVPGDRPKPLGESVQVEAIARVAARLSSQSQATFQSLPVSDRQPRLLSFNVPTRTLRGGEVFTVTGQLQFPVNTLVGDYEFTLGWLTADGSVMPANIQPLIIDGQGNFSVEGVAPSLASGFPYHNWGVTDALGLVYRNPKAKTSGFLGQTPVEYGLVDVQPITIHVTDQQNNPLVGAVVVVDSNAVLVPPGYSFEDDGFPLRAAGTQFQESWPALYGPVNQFQSGIREIAQNINPVSGCPLTLSSGVTDSNGDFTFNILPFINELLDKTAYEVSQLDINTTVHGPGKATFSVKVNAIHLGHALVNDDLTCTGQRFDFQYDYGSDLWLQREGPEGEFVTPFDPDQTVDVPLPVCQGNVTFPADPYMPGLPKQQYNIGGEVITQISGLRGFPNTNGANFNLVEAPQLRLPHLSSVFGAPSDVHLFFGNQDQGEMQIEGALCGADGIEYVIDLPQLVNLPAQTIEATIVGQVADDTMERPLRIQIAPGPTWINDAQLYEQRTISWEPDQVLVVGHEPVQSQDASVSNVPQDVGDLDNDNLSGGTTYQSLTPSGSARWRFGMADATAAGNDGTDTEDSTQASAGQVIELGQDQQMTIVDTGKIPLFRYVWGIPPIADATIGADIWFKALYYYYGLISHNDGGVNVDLTTAATANAGLDLWFDVSIILDVVNITAFALPQVLLGMPIVIENGQLNAAQSEPCFQFLLDVAFNVSVGWCPFCISGGGQQNLIDLEQPNNCQIPGIPGLAGADDTMPDAGKGIPLLPAIDRIDFAVDGLGEAMVVFGDGSGSINVQYLQGGVPGIFESLPAAAGASAPSAEYLSANHAVMVWAQSSLSDTDFYANTDPLAVTPFQHLVYSVWDGVSWSAATDLTLPTSGDGNPVLASCPAHDPQCPPGGEILAVWVHDQAGNIADHQFRLRYAFYSNLGWSAIQDIDSVTGDKQLQPAPHYVNGEPMVAYVSNPGVTPGARGAALDLSQRRLAYRFLRQPAGAQVATGLSTGVGSPSLSSFSDGSLVMAYSVATDLNAFLGTRRSLHTAIGNSCSAGICVWSQTQRIDSLGREIYVEKPQITVNAMDHATVAFRQLGVEFDLPGDPPGVLTHTGELAKISFDFSSTFADAIPLSVDGAINLKVAAAIDPVANGLMVASIQGPAVRQEVLKSLDQPAEKAWGVHRQRLGSGAVLLTQQALLPDFELLDAQPSQDWIASGGNITVAVTLRNNGPDWSEPEPLNVAAYWDGPAGLGTLATSETIVDLAPGGALTIPLSVDLPAAFEQDDLHDLHVVVNGQGLIAESEAGNNSLVVPLGALPVPDDLRVTADSINGVVIVNWQPVSDPRVSGYRVYRRNPDGTVLAVGSTHVPGFADFSAYRDNLYEYFVVSHSPRLMESAASAPVVAMTFGDVLFRDSLESF